MTVHSFSTFLLADGAPVLTYTSASKCAKPFEFEKVVIRFACGKDESGGQPVFKEYDANTCTHHFEWHSSVACEVRYMSAGNSGAECIAMCVHVCPYVTRVLIWRYIPTLYCFFFCWMLYIEIYGGD